MKKLKMTIPKGSLEKNTYKLFNEAGLSLGVPGRSYRPSTGDPELEIKILRPQEIPTMISQGAHDIGISGEDWRDETNADIIDLLDLEYGKIKLVLAVPEAWKNVNSLDDLLNKFNKEGKKLRIFNEYLKTCQAYLSNNKTYQKLYGNKIPMTITPWAQTGENKMVQLLLSFGATEAKPPEDADAIIDVTETGTTLVENKLKIIDVLRESTAHLFANKEAMQDSWKKEKIEDIRLLLLGVVEARKKLHIFMNIKEENISLLLEQLPALKRPTIAPLEGEKGWFALNTIIPRKEFLKLLPILRKYAQGIVVHEPRQILPFE
ncbi:MAG: ATP phosphoribosyltransferase [Candidatus Lokiarchaeota archaeon]|nr:ATP phosphoribosyltransferase [Candidatus Lokiarchaeota archaeon]